MRKTMFTLMIIFAVATTLTHTGCSTTKLTMTLRDETVLEYRKNSFILPDKSALYISSSDTESGFYTGDDGEQYPYHQLPADITESNVPTELNETEETQ